MMDHQQKRCPVCAAHDTSATCSSIDLRTGRGLRQWFRCPDCHSYYDAAPFKPDEEVVHTRTRPWGSLQRGTELNQFKTRMFVSVLKLLKRFGNPGGSLLDVGCSYGGFLQHARSQGYAVSGMDIVPEAVDYVRGEGIRCQAANSVEALDIPDGSQDVVSVLDCNCYWPDQIVELRAIRRKLRPGGLLVMRVVDKSWLFTFGLAVRKWLPRVGETLCNRAVNDHRVSIPVPALLRVLASEQFRVLYASPAGAQHSDRSSLAVKAAFVAGYLVWLLTRRYLAPGCLILARKTEE